MNITTVTYLDNTGKKYTEVLSKNQAVRLSLAKFNGEVSKIKVKEVSL